MARNRKKKIKSGNWFTRLSIGKKIGIICVILVVGLAASAAGFVMSKLSKLDTEKINVGDVEVNEGLDTAPTEGYSTFVVFGVDSREGELDTGTRTDCIILVVLDNETKEIKMCSLYRDTLLDIADGAGTLQKCNAAYAYGSYKQAISMLNKNLDLSIDGYVTVDFTAIADAIDMLGGVEIDVKEEELSQLNKYINETAEVAGKKANAVESAGKQTLDGVQATTYARIRKTAGGDFQRTNRQRTVIEAMVKQIQKSKLSTLNAMIDQLLPEIQTSLSASEILGYAANFMEYSITDSKGFPFDKTTDTVDGYGSIVIPVTLESNVQQLQEFLYGNTDFIPSSTVSDINSRIISVVGERTPMGDDGSDDYEEPEADTGEDTAEDTVSEDGGTETDSAAQSNTPKESTKSSSSSTSSGTNSTTSQQKSSVEEDENPTLVFH